ncbi:hypothetical protein KVT40_008450 [Elsinoe batatas]|uniref:Uncharacterized protein n=1 Tax=Elsinoe batatas TaxID=2601811 RepID=A0A8K0PFE1_9PEZI|nr:hypothetical protein KVT40_008450 [Elsinoe batatas]
MNLPVAQNCSSAEPQETHLESLLDQWMYSPKRPTQSTTPQHSKRTILDVRIVARPVTVRVTDSFNFAKFEEPIRDPGRISSDALGPPIFNISYTDGTSARYAAQSFVSSATDAEANATVEADVNVFSADLQCERAQWAYSNSSQKYIDALEGGKVNMDFTSDSFTLSRFTLKASTGMAILQGWDMSKPAVTVSIQSDGWLPNYTLVNTTCNVKKTGRQEPCYLVAFGYSANYDQAVEDIPANTQTAFADITTAPILPAPTRAESSSSAAPTVLIGRQIARLPSGKVSSNSFVNIKQMAALFCKPTISFARARVSSLSGRTSSADGVEVIKILEEIPLSSVGAPSATTTLGLLTNALGKNSRSEDMWFTLMSSLARRPSTYDYLEPEILSDVARETFQRMAAQYAKQQIMEPTSLIVQGQVTNVGPRLTMESLTLRLMDSFVIVFALCALFICLFFAFPGLPRDFSSIGALALLLKSSPDLKRLCSGLGTVRLKYHNTWMQGYRFNTVYGTDSEVATYSMHAELDPTVHESSTRIGFRQDIKWWRPAMFNTPLRTLTVVLPLLLVAAIEAGYRYSTKHQGYGIVPTEGYLKYVCTFLPAIIMVATASTFSILDFATRTFQSFHSLSGERKARSRDLVETPFGHFAVYSLLRSVSRQQWALTASSLAVCISPFLTIVVSDLLQGENVPITQSLSTAMTDTFVPSTINRYDYNPDAARGPATFLTYLNVSWPTLTYENLVLPNFTVVANASSPSPLASRFQVVVPAAAVVSTCSMFDSSRIAWNTSALFLSPSPTNANTSVPGPMRWSVDGQFDISNYLDCTYLSDGSNVGARTDKPATFSIRNDNLAADGVYGSYISFESGSLTCDGNSFKGVLALMRNSNNATTDVLLMDCKHQVDIVTANVTAKSTMELTNATLVDNPSLPRRTFSTDQSVYANVTVPCAQPQAEKGPLCLLEAMAADTRIRLNASEIFDNLNSTRVEDSVSQLYSMIIAQRFSYYHRSPMTQPSSWGSFIPATLKLDASILDQTEHRVVQSRISTRILQSLLGVLSLCAVIAWSCTRSKKVLTKNPQSIAAMASLLVDADMLRDIPPGAEFMNDKELKRNGIFEGGFYSIGWWGEDQGRRFGIDVGQAEKPT